MVPSCRTRIILLVSIHDDHANGNANDDADEIARL